MRRHAPTITVELIVLDDPDSGMLPESELQALRAFLPDLMRELAQLNELQKDEE